MNLVNLRTFLSIVETGSLVRASEELNVTQSTVTARLKALEDELGQTLLLRHKSGATLTAPGYKLRRYAEVILGLWRQARLETSLPPDVDALCNVGCHPDLWHSLGRDLARRLRRAHPRTALSVWPGEQGELDRLLGDGLIDAALSYQPLSHGNQTVRELPPERLILCSDRPGSPSRFDPGYVLFDAGEQFREDHAAAYADADVARTSYGSAAWTLEHLLDFGGSAYLPEPLAAPHLAAGRLHRVADAPAFSRKIYLITNDRTVASWPLLSEFGRERDESSGNPN